MAKIVYMSDSPTISTGYGRVSKELATAMHEAGHEIIMIGWGHAKGAENPFPFKIIPCDAQKENYGEEALAEVIREFKPDILFTLGDPWMTEYIPNMEERQTVAWVSYFPIDGYPIPKEWHSVIRNVDVPVTFSKFAYDLVGEVLGNKPVYIPHGVDTDTFKPLDNQDKLKERIVGDSNKFIVGSVARNQPRKNLPALIKAFSEFAKGKDDVALYLHTQIKDVGWNIVDIVERFDISDKSYSTNGFTALKGVRDDQLNEIYNIFDVFALPTMAEGFGLPILEAQSAGVPVLVTDYSACRDLVVDRQELVKVKDTLIMGRNIEQAIVDTDDLVRKMNIMYNDWKKKDGKKLKELSQKGQSLAKELDWKNINKEFLKLIDTIEPKAKEIDKVIKPMFYRI